MEDSVKKTKRSIKLATVLAAGALLATACGSKSSSTTTAAPESTTANTEAAPTTAAPDTTVPAGPTSVTYAAEQEYTSYNNGAADQGLFANTLVLNMTLPGPWLALPDNTFKVWDEMMDSVTLTSTSPQVVEYKVKEAAVWSDGAPIGCDDFYLAWLSSNGKAGNRKKADGTDELDADGNPIPVFNTAGTTGYDQVASVTCDATGKVITATFDTPFADWKGLFGGLLPAHVVAAKSGVADIKTATPEDIVKVADFWNTGFVGFNADVALSGGWYKISEFNPGKNLILVKNEKFWGKPANIDQIVFLAVPDATAQPQALENGDVQVISPQPNPDLLAQLQAITGVTASVNSGLTYEHYDMNLKNEHLADLKVRQAFALCVPRQEMVDTLLKPLNDKAGVLNSRIFIPTSPFYKDNLGEFANVDIEKSKALLAEAGYTVGSDGIAEKGGKKLSLRLGRRDPNPRRQKENELTIESCKQAGFDLTDDPAEKFNAERLPASDYDIALFAWVSGSTLSGNNSIYLAPADGGGQNWNNWSNPQVKVLMDQANVEFDDAKRADLYNQLDALVTADMVTIPLFQLQELVAYSNTVTGVVYHGNAGVTWNANEWALAAS